jgi:hypothetical protein
VGAAAAAACVYVAAVNPSHPGRLPTIACPFHAATGLWCPGCGLTRAVHAVLTGHPGAAFGMNALWPVVVVAAAWAWLSWISPRVPPLTRVSRHAWSGVIVAAVVFGVLRNLPGLSFLAP